MLNKSLYIDQLITQFEKAGMLDMSSDDYISGDVLRKHITKFVNNNIKYGMDYRLTDNQIQIVLDDSKIETIKNTITFLNEQNVLTPSGIDSHTGEFIYTLTDHGKTLYKKIITD